MKRLSLMGVALLLLSALGATSLAGGDAVPRDKRLGKPIDYNGYFPWTPPATKEEWEKRRPIVREQVLVANGLWPMPEKISLKPVIHGKIERDGYTVEKVFFASLPGHYVTGNLYRPTNATGKLAGVLCPHGHWANGRFYEAKDGEIKANLKSGAEKTAEGAKYPLQARCAHLARMGCVVFHYDMVGYADSTQIGHRAGFLDVESELRLQNFMGLQTFNSIRALDFITSLPEVDPSRIGVTGASGGGTQTFILCGIDDRPAAAFPAVMVSTAMQGGCICENCSYLRVGTGNIELTGLFAPKPVGMAAANDWTKEIETKGLPELKALYKLYGVPDNVMAKAHVEFPHNYNQVSRELMYNFFNKHLKLGQSEPVIEKPFVPIPPKQLSVFDAEHPVPKDAVNSEALRKHLTADADAQLRQLTPKDAKGLTEYRRVLGGALRAMITDALPATEGIEATKGEKIEKDGLRIRKLTLSRKGQGEAVPAVGVHGKDFDGRVIVWVHPDGLASIVKDGTLTPAAQKIIDSKAAILAVEVLRTGASAGEKTPPVNKSFAGYTYGYNRPLVADRVHDILTAVAFARGFEGTKTVHLLGADRAGPWVALARGLCGTAVARTAADLNQFRFEQIKSFDDEMMLPGALKYGGVPSLAALAAPHELFVHNTKGTGASQALAATYAVAGEAGKLQQREEKAEINDVIAWLLK